MSLLLLAVLTAAPSPQLTWSVISPSGAARLMQTALPDDACALECEVSGKSSWKVQSCLGRGTDFNFVSNDCATVLTLFEYPLKTGTPDSTAVAAALVGGTAMRVFRLGELGAPSRGEGKRIRWLGGVVGEPGVKPHLNSAETGIEFMTVDGQAHTVRFANPDDFIPQRAVPVAQAPATDGLYQFTDGDGATQFVMGLNQVPKKFRKSARPVESEVGVMQETRRAYRPSTPSTSSAPVATRPAPSPQPTAPAEPEAFKNTCGIYGLTQDGCMGVMGYRRVQPLIVTLPKSAPPKPPESPYKPPPSPYR